MMEDSKPQSGLDDESWMDEMGWGDDTSATPEPDAGPGGCRDAGAVGRCRRRPRQRSRRCPGPGTAATIPRSTCCWTSRSR